MAKHLLIKKLDQETCKLLDQWRGLLEGVNNKQLESSFLALEVLAKDLLSPRLRQPALKNSEPKMANLLGSFKFSSVEIESLQQDIMSLSKELRHLMDNNQFAGSEGLLIDAIFKGNAALLLSEHEEILADPHLSLELLLAIRDYSILVKSILDSIRQLLCPNQSEWNGTEDNNNEVTKEVSGAILELETAVGNIAKLLGNINNILLDKQSLQANSLDYASDLLGKSLQPLFNQQNEKDTTSGSSSLRPKRK